MTSPWVLMIIRLPGLTPWLAHFGLARGLASTDPGLALKQANYKARAKVRVKH